MKFVDRFLNFSLAHSFFLFGARNTGKSTLLHHRLKDKPVLWIDLLDLDQEEKYARRPSQLKEEILALSPEIKYIVIDEIQKLPKLLNSIHQLIEKTDKIFILTGSSARKLRHGGANLLAGRAFISYLYPLTSLEIGENFNLEEALHWGTLPAIICKMSTSEEKMKFLQAYAQTYLKEEIWLEQFIRKFDPFRKFLEVAAQCNGEIVNFSKIAQDVGVDDKTIKQYFVILEDTLIGFFLEPFHISQRKRLHLKPKFYFFDTGVCRSLSHMLTVPLTKSTSVYGHAFEHFIILECIRLAQYYYPEYRFSYLKTKDDVEIDLIVERPGKKLLCIEIKSTDKISVEKLKAFSNLVKDIKNCEAICISQEKIARRVNDFLILPWKEALQKYFTPSEK